MPFRRLRLRQFYTRLGAALLAGLLPLLLGVLIVSWQTFAGMKQDAEERLLHAREMLERTLDHAHQAAAMVQGSVGRPCEAVVQGLRDQVATVPDVRTVNLAKGEVVYCSSLYGPYQGPLSWPIMPMASWI